MSFVNKLSVFARSFATAVKPAYRGATAVMPIFRSGTVRDADSITRMAIQEGWHVGPYDFPTFFEFDPQSYHIGEVDGKHVCQIGVIEFPKHHYHGGGMIVAKEFRQMGYSTDCVKHILSVADKRYTVGGDISLTALAQYESLGFEKFWDIHVAMLDLEKIAKLGVDQKSSSLVMPIQDVDLDKLLKYDHRVFGTPRDKLMTRWINTPGSFGWAAIDDSNNITGYIVLKQVIRGGGTEIGLAMAPLFANDKDTAKLLIKTAGQECLANPAIPKTKLELFHPSGDICGEGAAKLMEELGAEMIHIAHRVYTNGIPEGRRTRNIYGITSPTCD